jgi:tRNA-dihydrouridine synthase
VSTDVTTVPELRIGPLAVWPPVVLAPDEQPRSIQLYGVDPDVVGRAVAMVAGEGSSASPT